MFRYKLESIIDFWRRLVKHNFMPDNRTETIIEVVAVLFWMSTSVLFYLFLFWRIPAIVPWDKTNILLLIASYFIVDGLTYGILYRNLSVLNNMVKNRSLENILLMPVKFRRHVSFRLVQFASLIQIPLSLGLYFFFRPRLDIITVLWLASLVLGFFISYLLWYLVCLTAFWWNFTERLTVVSEELFSVGLFPVTIFLGTKLFPAAFIYLLTASYPAQALLENRLPQIIILQLFFIFLLNIVVNFFQKQGIKKYTS